MVGRPLWERKVPSSSLGAPMFPMNNTTDNLPNLTFRHRADRGYKVLGNGSQHIVESSSFEPLYPFEALVLSVDYHPRENESLLTEVQIQQHGVWSKFFKLGFYSATEKYSFDTQEDESGAVYVDVLRCAHAAQRYRFRLTINGQADIPAVTVCLHPSSRARELFVEVLPAEKRLIKVKPISQMQLDVAPEVQKRLCSPTSLTMALNALGVKADALETAKAVYDKYADIYGNWTFNTAYACACGVDACVTRFKKLSQLERYVTPDSLVLATIGYGPNELSDAAIEQTPGHFVVICGWENEWIRVADPAASETDDVLRFYNAKEFAKVWLANKNGAAYLVRKK